MTSDNDMGKGSAVAGGAAIAAACFFSLALYNVIELTVLIFVTFKKRRGLYFWSFVIATWGIAIHGIGWLMKDFGDFANPYITLTITTIGWYAMVSGQSVVLYSRLHLIVYSRVVLRAVLVMIITIAIVAYIPTSVMTFGASSDDSAPFLSGYYVVERLQVVLFFVQEVIISSIYIWATSNILRSTTILGGNGHKLMKHLLLCNVLIIILNVTIIALEFSNLFGVQIGYKTFAYSVKLKLEFSILNRLVDFVRPRDSASYCPSSIGGSTAQLDRAETHHTFKQSIREKMKLGHRAHNKESRGCSSSHDVDRSVDSSASNGAFGTSEPVVITDWASIPLARTTDAAQSEITGEHESITGEDAAPYLHPATSHKATVAHVELPEATHDAAQDRFWP